VKESAGRLILSDIFNSCSKQNWDSNTPKLLLGQALTSSTI